MVIGLVFFASLVIAAIGIGWMHSRQNWEIQFHSALPRTILLESDAFPEAGQIPETFTAKGEGISPPLAWSNLPPGTKSLALSVTDEDLPVPAVPLFRIVHWGLFNISKDVGALKAGISGAELTTAGIRAVRNWGGGTGYYPPRPAYGTHRYAFRIYALNVEKLDSGIRDRTALLAAMKGRILAYGELNGTSTR